MIRSWLSYLEHAVEQAQEAGELDPNASPREVAFQLDAFAQASNAQYQLFRDPQVFDDARRAIQERLESLRPASRTGLLACRRRQRARQARGQKIGRAGPNLHPSGVESDSVAAGHDAGFWQPWS